MSTISTVTSFEFEGQLYRTLQAAKRAKAHSDLKKFMEARGVGRGGEWDADMIRDFLTENAMELVEFLDHFTVDG